MSHHDHPLYRREDLDLQFTPLVDFGERYTETAAGESRPAFYASSTSQIHPHPLFTRQDFPIPEVLSSQNRLLDPHRHHQVYQSPSPLTNIPVHPHHIHSSQEPQSWPPYEHPISQPFNQNSHQLSYAAFPSPSPFPPARLSPPPLNHQSFHFKGSSQTNTPTATNARLTLAGSLDPATGIFYRTPEHPRLRTAQACEKCRTRKAKCSGEHPSCKRCITRGLVCDYAKEGRVRGPNKPKPKVTPGGTAGHDASDNAADGTGKTNSRHRTSSSNGSAGSPQNPDPAPAASQTLEGSDGELAPSNRAGRRSLVSSRRSSPALSDMRLTLHRHSDLHLETASTLFTLANGSSSGSGAASPVDPSFLSYPQAHAHNVDLLTDGHQNELPVHYQLQDPNELMSQSGLPVYSPHSSSIISLKRIPRGMAYSEGGHPLSIRTTPPHDLVHVALPLPADNIDPGLNEPGLIYHTGPYYNGSPGEQQQQDGEMGLFSSSYANNTNCGSPLTSVSASTMGSPLTPTSAIASSSHLAHISAQQNKTSDEHYDTRINRLDAHFDLDQSMSTSQSELDLSFHEQENHQTYHPSI